MTREEKIAELINIRDNFNYTLAPREVFDDAIKALKQEPDLDKLRAEIEQKLGTHGNISLYNRAIYDVLQILNKYREAEK